MGDGLRGPMCSTRCGPGWIDDGTKCLNRRYPWGPIGRETGEKTSERGGRSEPLETLLQEAAEKLEKVGFGIPVRTGRFDREYWTGPYEWSVGGLTDHVFLLKEGRRASEAVQAIFMRPGRWTLDCAMFVQAILLYCQLQRFGPRRFDEAVSKGKKATRGTVMLRQHRSTGLTVKREQAFSPVSRGSQPADAGKASEEAVKAAPIGSVVVFTNMDAPDSSGYRHENTIKIEPNLFIAHGVETGSAFATREAIERKLVKVAVKYNQQLANVKQVVSVTWVTVYQL